MSCVLRDLRMQIALALPAALFAVTAAAQTTQATSASAAQGRAQERAQGLDLSLTGGGSWSDNIGRVALDEEEGTIGRAGVEIGYEQRSRRIETDIDLNAAYEHYFDDTYDDDVIGGVDASLNLGIVPERLLWVFQENFGQITSDPFAASTPENREDINYFTTGPDLLLSFGSATSLRLSGRYSDVNYEFQNVDNQQYGASLSLARRLSGTATLSFNVEGTRFEFDDPVANDDYDRYQAFVRYDVEGSRTRLTVDAGYTSLDIDEETSDGLLARLSLVRQLSPASALTVTAGTQFSDAGDMFRSGQDNLGVSLDSSSIVGTSDPFESNFGSLAYDFNRNRTAFGFSATYSKEQYETATTLDRDLTTYAAYFSRQLSRAVSARVFLQLEQEEFDVSGFEDEELGGGAYLDWRLGRTLSLRLQYDRFDRDSTDPTTEYTENRVSLFAIWSPMERQ